VGALCIVDHKPRTLSSTQLKMLQDIAKLVEEELEQPLGADVAHIERVPMGS
jgi:hypothetical protein